MYMKTNEMIKRLEENPKARFVSNREPDNPISINKRGILVWEKQGNPFEVNIISAFYAGTLEIYKWKEIKESVSWQIAFQAWLNGKTIYYIRDGEENLIYGQSNYLGKCGTSLVGLTKHEIGKFDWYIKD